MKTFETAFASAKDQMDKATQQAFTAFDEIAGLGKDNYEAVVKANTVVVKGAEEISKTVAALVQAQIEQTVATMKAAFGCTTFNQFVELQNETVKTGFDKAVAEANKLSELSMKVANEAFEPIKARVDVTVQKLVKTAA